MRPFATGRPHRTKLAADLRRCRCFALTSAERLCGGCESNRAQSEPSGHRAPTVANDSIFRSPPERGPRGTDPSPPTGFGRGRRRRCRSRTPNDVRQRARAALARAQAPLRGLGRRGRRSSPPSDDRSKIVHGGTFDQAAIADKANRAVELARSCLRHYSQTDLRSWPCLMDRRGVWR